MEHIKIQTQIVSVDPLRPDRAAVERAAALLRKGEVVVFPTETVYGLGGDAFQPAALERIFAAKGRPFSDPLIVHIADESELQLLTLKIPAQAKLLAEAFWPGPLTLILPRGPRVPSLVTAGLETVAVRMPSHPVARALIRALGSPIAAPSANRFMHISPTTAEHALDDLDGRVPLILDSGPSEVGVESTVLDLCAETPTILRPGGVSLEALQEVLPSVRLPLKLAIRPASDAAQGEHSSQKAPGQLLTHYAPSIPLLLYEGSEEAMQAAMEKEVRRRMAQGEHVGVLIANEDIAAFAVVGLFVSTVGMAADPAQVAANLFDALRMFEYEGVDVILCRSFAEQGLGLAVRDRLVKAAGGKVISV